MEVVVHGQVYAMSPMAVSHLPDVLAIEQQSHYSPWSENQFRTSIQSTHQCWILLEQATVVAYCVTSTAADEAELLNIAVSPAFRGVGIAQTFLQSVCEQFDSGVTTLFLEVRESNQAAIALYHSLGFNELGKRSNYYPAESGREHALIMAKTLSL